MAGLRAGADTTLDWAFIELGRLQSARLETPRCVFRAKSWRRQPVGPELVDLSPHRGSRQFPVRRLCERHLPGQLAAERFLAGRSSDVHPRAAGRLPAAGPATEPVFTVLDANRRAQARWK